MTRRTKGEGSIYTRKDGRLVGQYFVDGKTKFVYGRTKTEVKEKLEKAIEKIKNSIDFECEKMSFNEWLDEWLNSYAKNSIKLSTLVSYDGIIHRHIQKHKIGAVELSKLNTRMFQKYFNEKSVSGRMDNKEGGLSPKTILNQYNMIHSALDQAVINGYMLKNPLIGVRLPRQEHKEMRVLTTNEQTKLMIAVNRTEEIGACGINIALYTGMRLGEIIGLQWQDIDFENKKLSVKRTLNRLKTFEKDSKTATKIMINEPKTKNSIREIPIINPLYELLKKQYECQNKCAESLGIELKKDTFVVTNQSLKFYEPKTYQELFGSFVETSGIEKANFHSLRHPYVKPATKNILKAQGILERNSLKVLVLIYYHYLSLFTLVQEDIHSEFMDNRELSTISTV